MDKNVKSFLLPSSILIFLFLSFLSGIFYAYRFSTIKTYYYILLFLMLLTIILILFFVVEVLAILFAYKSKKIDKNLLRMAKTGLNIVVPVIMSMPVLKKGTRDNLRSFYISINNTLVRASLGKYSCGDILLLLPHCLQGSDCGYKITNDIRNCKKCGKCCIGGIHEMVSQKGINVRVVTGGTAARKLVGSINPKVILSVACERDLAAGIADVGNVPVIGLINDRPNGPCINTRVDADKLKETLDELLDSENHGSTRKFT